MLVIICFELLVIKKEDLYYFFYLCRRAKIALCLLVFLER